MNSHQDIIDLWETRADFARDVGAKPGSGRQWYANNHIPGVHWHRTAEIAQERAKSDADPVKRALYAQVTPALLARLGAADRAEAGATA